MHHSFSYPTTTDWLLTLLQVLCLVLYTEKTEATSLLSRGEAVNWLHRATWKQGYVPHCSAPRNSQLAVNKLMALQGFFFFLFCFFLPAHVLVLETCGLLCFNFICHSIDDWWLSPPKTVSVQPIMTSPEAQKPVDANGYKSSKHLPGEIPTDFTRTCFSEQFQSVRASDLGVSDDGLPYRPISAHREQLMAVPAVKWRFKQVRLPGLVSSPKWPWWLTSP